MKFLKPTNFGGENKSITGLDIFLEQTNQTPSPPEQTQALPVTMTNQTGAVGKLMTDANGNKAYVFPDGTIQEVQ